MAAKKTYLICVTIEISVCMTIAFIRENPEEEGVYIGRSDFLTIHLHYAVQTHACFCSVSVEIFFYI